MRAKSLRGDKREICRCRNRLTHAKNDKIKKTTTRIDCGRLAKRISGERSPPRGFLSCLFRWFGCAGRVLVCGGVAAALVSRQAHALLSV